MLWTWARRRHPHKPAKWIKAKYFHAIGTRKWVFAVKAKDRRGQPYRVPLITLSLGVVTNEHRKFQHFSQIAELAREMQSYAKTQAGSVFVVDRRDDPAER